MLYSLKGLIWTLSTGVAHHVPRHLQVWLRHRDGTGQLTGTNDSAKCPS